jgi:mobilome CxxCx(11)CxxC protein
MVLAWDNNVLTNQALMFVVGALSVIQVGVSIASLVKKWPEELAYSNKSAAANFQLSDEFKLLGLTAQNPTPTLQHDFALLVGKDQARCEQDAEKHVTEKEKCWGHRHGLKQFRRACAKCNEVPFDMKPSNCSVCGDFK